MIIQLTGNVNYRITLDPSVWIFDDRKITLEQLLNNEKEQNMDKSSPHENKFEKNPPVNKSITRFKKEQILKNTYVMPIRDFLNHAEIKDNAKEAILYTNSGKKNISIDTLKNSYLLFSKNGKPIKDNGPVYLYFGDGSNQAKPIKGIQKINII